MSHPRCVVLLRDGSKVEVLDVELVPGWARILVPRTRLEVDDDARVGRHVADGAVWESIPATRVRKIVGPVQEENS